MTRHFLLLILLLTIRSVHAQNETIVGTWQAFEEGDTIQLTFDAEGYALMSFNHETIGGRSYFLEGVECSLKYSLDVSKSPAWIDLRIIVKEDDSQFDFMLGIVEFSDDSNQMNVCLNFNGGNERPTHFIEEDTILVTKIE